MASLRKTSFDYKGAAAEHFAAQHKVMEAVRDSANIQEVRADDVNPEVPHAQVFGGAVTHYSNGNQPLLAVDAAGMADSALQTRTGTLENPLERNGVSSDIVSPSRSKPIPVTVVPIAPLKVPTPTRKPLLHKDGRTHTSEVF